MVHTVRCIKFGDVLLDENRRAFLLCSICHREFMVLGEFRKHLDSCKGVQHLFKTESNYAFEDQKGVKLLAQNGKKEFYVHNYKEVIPVSKNDININQNSDSVMDLISLEEELQNPRWYMNLDEQKQNIELKSTQQQQQQQQKQPQKRQQKSHKQLEYIELVAAVEPYVQFKENLKQSIILPKKQLSVKNNTAINEPIRATSATQRTKEMLPIGNKRKCIEQKRESRSLGPTLSPNRACSASKPISTIKDPPASKLLTHKPKLLNPTMANSSSINKSLVFSKINTIDEEIVMLTNASSQPSHAGNNCNTLRILPPPQNKIKNIATTTNPAATKPLIVAKPKLISNNNNNLNNTRVDTAVNTVVHMMPQNTVRKLKTNNAGTVNATTTSNAPTATSTISSSATQTDVILSKLMHLGLEIKRSSNNSNSSAGLQTKSNASAETLALLRKLQSNGVKCSLSLSGVSSAAATAAHVQDATPIVMTAPTIKRMKMSQSNSTTGLSTTTNTTSPADRVFVPEVSVGASRPTSKTLQTNRQLQTSKRVGTTTNALLKTTKPYLPTTKNLIIKRVSK